MKRSIFSRQTRCGGENYGWHIKEGPHVYNPPKGFNDFASLTAPIFYYDHLSMGGDGGQGSITGGYVYRGPSQSRLDGLYLCGDFSASVLFGIKKIGESWATNRFVTGYGPVSGPSTFGEDEEGRILMANYFSGLIYSVEDTGQVWPVEFSPPGPSLYSSQLRVGCATPGAEIHYTLNSTEPQLSDPAVPADGFVSITNNTTVRAKAFRADLIPSDTRAQTFTNRTAPPKITPPLAYIADPTNVTMTCETPGATIFYTTNIYGNPPVFTQYVGPFTVDRSLNIYAYAVADGLPKSEYGVAGLQVLQANPPQFSPFSGDVPSGTRLFIGTFTPGATIYYTLDGSAPTTNSLVYSEPLTLDGVVTVTAFVAAPGFRDSNPVVATFTATTTAPPTLDPPSYIETTNVSLSCLTAGATIYYTTDGTRPTKASPIYSGPIPILTNGTVVSTFASSQGHADSTHAGASYSLPRAEQVSFSPYYGLAPPGSTISLSCATPGSVIYYTIDDIAPSPTTNSTRYTAPIPIDRYMQIKAVAYAPLHNPSLTTSQGFGLVDQEPTIVTTIAGSPTAGWQDGPAYQAKFNTPSAICMDASGNLLVADKMNYRIRKISRDGIVSTLPGLFSEPTGVAVDAPGNIYVGENSCVIRKIDPTGNITEFARQEATYCYDDHWMPLALGPDQNIYGGFWYSVKRADGFGGFTTIANSLWTGAIAPALDEATNLYSAAGNGIFITRPDGTTEPYVGNEGAYSDGPRIYSAFADIKGAAASNAGELVVMDGTHVRRLRGDWVTTVAGAIEYPGYRNGPGTSAQFSSATGICLGPDGIIYVADSGNHCIRKIAADTTRVGMADDWQRAHFGVIGVDPDGDADNDGVSNGLEFLQGTDPNDATSRLAINAAPAPDASGRLHIHWNTVAGKQYQLQFSRDLIDWTSVGLQILGDGTDAEVVDPNIIDARAHWFYRVTILL